MRRPVALLALALILALDAGPAHAGGLIGGVLSWLGGLGSFSFASGSIWSWLTTSTIGRLVGGLAASALQARLARRNQVVPGVRGSVPGTGGLNPRSFGLGVYDTKGTRMMPDATFTPAGRPANDGLTQVLDLSDIPGARIRRVAMEGEWLTIDTSLPTLLAGQFLGGRFGAFAWMQMRTGTETTASPRLLANLATHPRPWTSDMIGTGIVSAIMEYAYRPTVFAQRPEPRFEVEGIPLYDPRLDSTVGGSGPQRWSDGTTWTFSENPIVELYNVMRGITLADLGTWGGKIDGGDLPFSVWSAEMTKCDLVYPRIGGGTEARFRAGLKVEVTDQPQEVAAALLDAANAEIADCGGTWKVRVAEPGLPVYFFTDADTLATESEQLDPFPTAETVYNGVRPVYTEPARLYEAVDGPQVTNSAWEAEDGEQRISELPLAAVTSETQAFRIAAAELKVQRTGMLTHRVPLPPDALVLEPLDTVAWTSSRKGYVGKLFEVVEKEDHPETAITIVTLRAVDADDYLPPPLPATGVAAIGAAPGTSTYALSGVALSVGIFEAAGVRRRVLKLTWPGIGLDGKGLDYEIRRQGDTALLHSGAVLDATIGTATPAAEPLPGQTYEARVRLASIQPQDWSGWVAVSVPAMRSVGSASLSAVSPAKTVTNAVTTWDPVASVSVADSAFTGQESGHAKLVVALSGTASARILWRLIARQTPTGGAYTVFEKIEELTSARSLVLSGSGSVAAPWTAFDVTIEVSGELLPAGATATISQSSIQFITPHA